MKISDLFEQLEAIGIEVDSINLEYIQTHHQEKPLLNVFIKDRIGIFKSLNIFDICIVTQHKTLYAVIQTKLPHDLVKKHLKEITETAQANQIKRNENA